jgi:hypothetical protein
MKAKPTYPFMSWFQPLRGLFELRPVLVKTTLQLSVAAPLITEDLFCHQLKAQIY